MPVARFALHWLVAFVFTQAIEIPIYRRTLDPRFWVCFGASAMTHPVVWLVLGGRLLGGPWPAQVAVAELFAWLAEAAYFRFGFERARAVRWSLIANASSLAFGLVIRGIFG